MIVYADADNKLKEVKKYTVCLLRLAGFFTNESICANPDAGNDIRIRSNHLLTRYLIGFF